MERKAKAVWRGGLKEGEGRFALGSGVIQEQRVSFRTRFEDEPGTNPEELVAAAHASCFCMALSAQLGERGIIPEAIETTCIITLQNLTLTRSVLNTVVHAEGADEGKIRDAAEAAKTGCPISRALKLDVILELTMET